MKEPKEDYASHVLSQAAREHANHFHFRLDARPVAGRYELTWKCCRGVHGTLARSTLADYIKLVKRVTSELALLRAGSGASQKPPSALSSLPPPAKRRA